jgi:small multidrug resistance pump
MQGRAAAYLGVAIVAEVIATAALKSADGFTRIGPSLLSVAGYGIAFFCLSLALRTVPIGIAYGLWSGIGIVLVTLVAWLVHGQRLDAPSLVGLGLIAAGAVVLQVFSGGARP